MTLPPIGPTSRRGPSWPLHEPLEPARRSLAGLWTSCLWTSVVVLVTSGCTALGLGSEPRPTTLAVPTSPGEVTPPAGGTSEPTGEATGDEALRVATNRGVDRATTPPAVAGGPDPSGGTAATTEVAPMDAGASHAAGSNAPGGSSEPGTTALGTTALGTTALGTTAPGTTPPDTAEPDTTAPLTRPPLPSLVAALDLADIAVVGGAGPLGRVVGWQIARGSGTAYARVLHEDGEGESILPLASLSLLVEDTTNRRFLAAAVAPTPSTPADEVVATDDEAMVELFARGERVTAAGVVGEVEGSAPVVLKLRNDENHYHRVITGPEAFLEASGALPARGEEVIVEGVRARDAAGAYIVAQSVRVGASLAQLRSAEGRAAWNVPPDPAAADTLQGPSWSAAELRSFELVAKDGVVGPIADVALGLGDDPVVSLLVRDGDGWIVVPWVRLEVRDEQLWVDAARNELRRLRD